MRFRILAIAAATAFFVITTTAVGVAGAQIRGVEPCLGDLDGDFDVDLSDLSQLLSNYGQSSGMTYQDGDLDGDGDVDFSDLAGMLGVYGDVCPSTPTQIQLAGVKQLELHVNITAVTS